jgi:hypothetical protein
MQSFSKVIPLVPNYKFWPINWRFGMLDKYFQDVHWCIIETPWIHLVTSCRWVQIEVAHPFWKQWCNRMMIVLARCQHIYFSEHIFALFVLRRDLNLMWPNIWYGKNINQEHISFFNNMHESLVPSNNLKHLDLHVLPKSSLRLKFCMPPSSCLFLVAQCTWSWFLLDIVVKVSHFGATCLCVSKWRFIVR